MKSVNKLQDQVGEAFKKAFGRTSLRARLRDNSREFDRNQAILEE